MKDDDLLILPDLTIPLSEVRFRTSRSGGPGGQNVNKVESKVELLFDVAASMSLTEGQRARLFSSLGRRIDTDGIFHLSSQVSRSQRENKEAVLAEFERLVKLAFRPRKKRMKTNPTRASKEKRLRGKKIRAEKKKYRSFRGGD